MLRLRKKRRKTVPKPNTSYTPSPQVTVLMSDTLQLAENVKKLDAAGITGNELDRKKKELKAERRRLDRRKVDVLNEYIFPSMANLTVFLEYMAKSLYVNDMFEEDLKALFLTKSSEVGKNKKSIFERFIEASCMTTILGTNEDGVEDNIPLPDFRLILCDIMQQSVYWAMVAIGQYKFDNPIFSGKTLMVDIDRARAWTSEVSYQAWTQLDFHKERRPALF